MAKSFNFSSMLGTGAMGVNTVKAVFRPKYPNITDYANDREMQRRGIDLMVEGLGWVEVKTDSHAPERFFFELEVKNHAGALDRCSAEYLVVVYPNYRVLYIIDRPALNKWLRDNFHDLKTNHPKWFHETTSNGKGNSWHASGVTVPVDIILSAIPVTVVDWSEHQEVIPANWKEASIATVSDAN